MTDINPTPSWAAVRQLEIGEFALGGANGNMNEQAKALAARSEFLKQRAAYQYNTLAEANADIANIALNQNVFVSEAGNGGYWYKATAGETSLTKSAYDPLTQAKSYTNQEISNQQRLADYKNTIKQNRVSTQLSQSTLSKDLFLDKNKVNTSRVNSNSNFTLDGQSFLTSYDFKNTSQTDVLDLKLLEGGLELSSLLLMPEESIVNGVKKSFWTTLEVSNFNTEVYQVTHGFRVKYILPKSYNAREMIAFDLTETFKSIGRSVDVSVQSELNFTINNGNQLNFLVTNDLLNELAFELTLDNARTVMNAILPKLVLKVRDTVELASAFTYHSALSSGVYEFESSSSITVAASIDTYKVTTLATNNKNYTQKSCLVKNNSNQTLENSVIELKYCFEMSEVFTDRQLAVFDENGVEYACQFAPDLHVNLSKDLSIGYYPDGSLRSGVITIIDDLAIDESKNYTLRVYSSQVKSDVAKPAVISETASAKWFSVFDYALRFNFVPSSVGYMLVGVASDTSLSNAINIANSVSAIVRNSTSESTTVSSVFGKDYFDFEVKNVGDLFIDFEYTSYTSGINGLSDKAIKSKTIYRAFSNGEIKCLSYHSPQQDIGLWKLYGIRAQLFSSTVDNCSYQNNRLNITKGSDKLDCVFTCYHGDIHRDGVDFGANRPSSFSSSALDNRFDMRYGWLDTIGSTSSNKWGFTPDDVWCTEVWLKLNSANSDSQLLLNKFNNIPCGFLSDRQTWQAKKRNLLNTIKDEILSFNDFWYSADAEVVKWLGSTTTIGNPANNSRFQSFPCLLVEFLATGKGSFDDIYNRFLATYQARYGTNYSNYGSYYATGGFQLSSEWDYIFKPLLWIYKHAQSIGDTAKINVLKQMVGSMANAIYDHAKVNDWGIPQNSLSSTKGASNVNAAGLYLMSVAIDMGLDIEGKYIECFNAVEQNFLTYFSPALNYITDNRSEAAPNSRYFAYVARFMSAYVQSCLILKREPIFNVAQFFLNALTADGQAKDIEYCISESRRGIRGALTMAMHGLVYYHVDSHINASQMALDFVIKNSIDSQAKPCRINNFFYRKNGKYTDMVGEDYPNQMLPLSEIWLSDYYGLL